MPNPNCFCARARKKKSKIARKYIIEFYAFARAILLESVTIDETFNVIAYHQPTPHTHTRVSERDTYTTLEGIRELREKKNTMGIRAAKDRTEKKNQ